MGDFYAAHPMAVIFIMIFLMVLILGIMIPVTVYLCSRFIQWYLRRHPEKMLDDSSVESSSAAFLFGDPTPVDDKGEDGFRL